AVQHLMIIAALAEQAGGEGVVHHLRFLKTHYVGRFFDQEPFDDIEPGTDAIDVPGSDTERLGHAVPLGANARLCKGGSPRLHRCSAGRTPVRAGASKSKTPAPGAWNGGLDRALEAL